MILALLVTAVLAAPVPTKTPSTTFSFIDTPKHTLRYALTIRGVDSESIVTIVETWPHDTTNSMAGDYLLYLYLFTKFDKDPEWHKFLAARGYRVKWYKR